MYLECARPAFLTTLQGKYTEEVRMSAKSAEEDLSILSKLVY